MNWKHGRVIDPPVLFSNKCLRRLKRHENIVNIAVCRANSKICNIDEKCLETL